MPMWMLIFPLPFSQTPFVLSLSKHRFSSTQQRKDGPSTSSGRTVYVVGGYARRQRARYAKAASAPIKFGKKPSCASSSSASVTRWSLPGNSKTMRSLIVRPTGSTGTDRKSVVEGKRVSVRVDHGGRRINKKNKNVTMIIKTYIAHRDALL